MTAPAGGEPGFFGIGGVIGLIAVVVLIITGIAAATSNGDPDPGDGSGPDSVSGPTSGGQSDPPPTSQPTPQPTPQVTPTIDPRDSLRLELHDQVGTFALQKVSEVPPQPGSGVNGMLMGNYADATAGQAIIFTVAVFRDGPSADAYARSMSDLLVRHHGASVIADRSVADSAYLEIGTGSGSYPPFTLIATHGHNYMQITGPTAGSVHGFARSWRDGPDPT